MVHHGEDTDDDRIEEVAPPLRRELRRHRRRENPSVLDLVAKKALHFNYRA
jgi:hypothetical protein